MVEGYAKCCKYLLFAFNLVFFLAGLVIFVVAIVVQNKINQYSDFFGGNNVAVGLIVLGCIIMIIAFFGCCGAYKENYCLVVTFGIILAIILLLGIIFVIMIYVKRDQITSDIDDDLTNSMSKYKTSQEVADAWDAAQQDFQCCGANNYTDWKKVFTTDTPDSCCKTKSSGCGDGQAIKKQADAEDTIYTTGCVQKVEDYMTSNLIMLGGIGIGLILIKVIGMVLAFSLAHYIRKEYQVM